MNSKGGIKHELYVRNSDNPIEKGIAADTYPVDVWNARFGVLEDSKINGINIASGEMVVEKDGDVYKIIFDFVDAMAIDMRVITKVSFHIQTMDICDICSNLSLIH